MVDAAQGYVWTNRKSKNQDYIIEENRKKIKRRINHPGRKYGFLTIW
jgi:hypothetical protein